MANRVGFGLLLGLLFHSGIALYAQHIPPLERTISITVTERPLHEVLAMLEQRGNFTFSYSSSILEPDRRVSIDVQRKTVRETLQQLFSDTIQYREKENYIILVKAAPAKPKASEEKSRWISGYVIDQGSGEKLPEVSVYEKRTLSSVITNGFGYFKIRLDRSTAPVVLTFSKLVYRDTAITIGGNEDVFLTVALSRVPVALPVTRESQVLIDSAVLKKEIITPVESFPSGESRVNIRNIKDTLFSGFQVSFLPFLGTHSRLSGNVVSDYSFNVLGGYNLGVRKFEMGGIFNVDRGNVSHVQMAGVFNVVGGEVVGVQAAGVINLNKGRVSGAQFAGAINGNLSSVDGAQFAGVMNINGGPSEGVQFAGVGNIQHQRYRGSQFAGVFNVATHGITGSQVAGVINFGRSVNGAQIGLLNIADSVKGIPIGFLSFVNSGYHQIELAGDEMMMAHLSFRTGVRAFYNIFTAGARPDTFDDPLWMMGYGIGTSPRLSPRLFLNIDLTASHVSRGHLERNLSLLNKAHVGVEVKLARKLSIIAGGTLNGYVTDSDEASSVLDGYMPDLIHDDAVGSGQRLRMWWGGKLGVRFL